MSVKTTDSIIPDALKNFDSLPSSGFVRVSVAKALIGVSNATLWRLIRAQKLRTFKHSPRTTSINVGELREFLAAKAGA